MSITIATTGLEDYLEGGKGKVKALITGGPGAGKTRASSFWPKPIYAACEDGLMSVADRNVPYAFVNSVEDMSAFINLLQAECRKPADQRRFETVVVDTIDAWQRSITQQYLKAKRKTELSGFEDWGWLDNQMVNLVAELMALPMNIVVLCHTKEKKGGKDDIDKFVLKLKGDIKDQLAADFDFVGMFDNDFGLVDGARGMVRHILWEPQPNADWLKARGGALTRTKVTFSPQDFEAIRDGIRSQLQGLQAATVVEEVATPEGAQPLPPTPGGPVGVGTGRPPVQAPAKPATKKAAAPPATPAATPPATPPAPPVAAPPPAAKRPTPEPVAAPVTDAEAIETVTDVLGGKVVEDTSAVVDQAPTSDVETPVATPDVVEIPAAAPGVVPNDADNFTVACGSPRYTNGAVATPGIGCGKPLTVTLSGGRVTGAEEGQNAQLIEITGLRTKAFLHNPCYSAAKG